MLSPLFQWTSGQWDQARGRLREDIEQITVAVNRLWGRAFGFDGFLKNETIDGTGTPGPLHTGTGGNITSGPVDLSTEITGRLKFANFVQIAASRLLGRRSSSAGDVEEIAVGAGLLMSGTTLSAVVTTAPVDYVVLSDGANPPSPVNDGAGHFIYVAYIP